MDHRNKSFLLLLSALLLLGQPSIASADSDCAASKSTSADSRDDDSSDDDSSDDGSNDDAACNDDRQTRQKTREQLCHYRNNGSIVLISVPSNKVERRLAKGDYRPIEFFADNDNDGWGDPDVSMLACEPAGAVVENDADPNDNDPTVPGNDGVTVSECIVAYYYPDADGDGFGQDGRGRMGCEHSPPAGMVTNNKDLDDTNPNITM